MKKMKLKKTLLTFGLALAAVFGLTVATSPGVSAGLLDTGLLSTWPDFRGNGENNGVVSAPTPTSMDNAVLYWSHFGGTGTDVSAPSSPILIGSDLVYTTKTSIVRLNTATGETVATGTMCKTSAFNITPPTYADGKIFVALKDGTVQAFDADTLESLWIYEDPLKGQPNSPITYHDGYIYTGFWNSEIADANYVCLSVTDPDPGTGNEAKTATWSYTHTGGFYWDGCYATDDYLIVGSENGTESNSDCGTLYSLNPATGAVIDSIDTNIVGDIRSTICYDSATKLCYFTSEGGYFHKIAVNNDGTFDHNSLKSLKLSGKSTSTPVVYNGRAYVGVMGTGQFTAYSGHNISVIDLSSWKVAYICPTQGFPQTSGLLTTAYEKSDGYVYVYFFDNYTPGKLRVIKDQPGQTAMISDSGYAPILFTPTGTESQYAICSPICDEYGTLYFKNDSGRIMALGSKITKIEITKEPDKTVYAPGATFDPTGMQVTAYYSNGLTRDISAYVSYVNGYDSENQPVYVSADKLTKTFDTDDSEINVYFTYELYQDSNNGVNSDDENKTNNTVTKPYATVDIAVLTAADYTKINPVIALIDKLKTDPSQANIDAAQTAYAALTATQRNGVTNRSVLNTIKVKSVTDLIDAFRNKIIDDNVAAARASYDKLTSEQKKNITNYAALTAAETTVKNKPFTDVQSGAWYYEEAYFALYNGLMTGTTTTTFAPDLATTRGMLVTVLYRYEGSPAVSGTTPFTDLSQDWYQKAILWAYQNKIVNGITATAFDPGASITREQLATILYRYCGEYKGYDVSGQTALNGFADGAKVQTYAQTAMKWAVNKSYISGAKRDNATYLDPAGSATRAQVATIMMRFIQSL